MILSTNDTTIANELIELIGVTGFVISCSISLLLAMVGWYFIIKDSQNG